MDPLDFKPMDIDDRRKILEFIRSSLKDTDPQRLRRALLSLDWVEQPEGLVAPLLELVREGGEELALVAMDGLSHLESAEAEEGLMSFLESQYEQDRPEKAVLRAECIRTLGKAGTGKSVRVLAGIVRGKRPSATEEDRMAAVEGLVSLGVRGERGVPAVLEKLHAESSGELKEALAQALRELNVSGWDQKGYLTIEGRFEGSGE